jgi:hypothetical protein
MRGATLGAVGLLAVAGLVGVTACSSSSSGPQNVSLEGNYTLTSFTQGSNDLSQIASGTLALTSSKYVVHMSFAGGVPPDIADSGSYTATDAGDFSETSSVDGSQVAGTYTLANNVLSVALTTQIGPITQVWQKQ